MNRLIFFYIAALLAAPAFSDELSGSSPLIDSEELFYSGGKVEIADSRLFGSERIIKKESGVMDGVYYSFYYSDGSGVFSGEKGALSKMPEDHRKSWRVRCSKDSMTDFVNCAATTRDLHLVVNDDGDSYVLVGSSHYPGTDVAIRIGSEAPLSASSDNQFDIAGSKKIISQMKDGVVLTTRYYKWPHKRGVDSSFELHGFDQVFSYLRWAVRKIK